MRDNPYKRSLPPLERKPDGSLSAYTGAEETGGQPDAGSCCCLRTATALFLNDGTLHLPQDGFFSRSAVRWFRWDGFR